MQNQDKASSFWAFSPEQAASAVHANLQGLSSQEAELRLKRYGYNTLKAKKHINGFLLFVRQFNNPLIFILLFCAILSLVLYDRTDACIILFIVFANGVLTFFQEKVVTGEELRSTDLIQQVKDKEIFAEIEPNQKEQIILALKKAGHVVGFLGDGINDVPALHAADVSISVDTGADVTKEVADIVLLEKDLSVLQEGVKAGRVTFANTLKYVFMATSANFGNMFSMAGASLFLKFLPLLPKQILLINLMEDFPEMTIATDHVDEERVLKPLKWDIAFIKKFMTLFGLISSIFDYATFGLLVWLKASVEEFRTGWFVESVVSAAFIVLIVRTFRPFYKSKPSKPLLIAVLSVISFTFILPYTPLAPLLGFTVLSLKLYLFIIVLLLFYVLFVEIAKKYFLRSLEASSIKL